MRLDLTNHQRRGDIEEAVGDEVYHQTGVELGASEVEIFRQAKDLCITQIRSVWASAVDLSEGMGSFSLLVDERPEKY